MESVEERRAAVTSPSEETLKHSLKHSQQPLDDSNGAEGWTSPKKNDDTFNKRAHSTFLAAVQQLTAARLEVRTAHAETDQASRARAGRVAYIVCAGVSPFLELLCALFPEHEFHVYGPAPELSVQPFGQGPREVPAWFYRHELLRLDRAHWEQREGDTVVFLGESVSLPGAFAGEPLVDAILDGRCRRQCSRCAAEIRTWLAYVRSAPSILQPEAEIKAVAALMTTAVKKLRLCCPFAAKRAASETAPHTQQPRLCGRPDAESYTASSWSGAQSTPTKPMDTTVGCPGDFAPSGGSNPLSHKPPRPPKTLLPASPIHKAQRDRSPAGPDGKPCRNNLAAEPPPQVSEKESPVDERPLLDWEQLSAEMLAFSADSHKKGDAKVHREKRGDPRSSNGRGRASAWGRPSAKK